MRPEHIPRKFYHRGAEAQRRKFEIEGGGIGSAEMLIVDSGEKPPVFENRFAHGKNRRKYFAPEFDMSNVLESSATVWWCFQVALFDQQGFFSRIDSSALAPASGW